MEHFFAAMFEDVRHGKSLISLLSLSDPVVSKQSKYTDHETNVTKNLALDKLHRKNV